MQKNMPNLLKLLVATVMSFSFTVAFAYDFERDGIYYNKIGENEVEVTYKNENWDNQNTYVGNIKIPSQVIYDGATYSVTGIGENAFFDCTGLTSVTIPNSVTSIGQGAFYYCPRLASVNFPNSLKSIGIYAFYNCLSLTSVTIPDSVTSIGPAVFGGCENIAQLSIERGNEKFFTDGHSIFEKLEGGKVELNNFIVWDVSYKIPSFVTSIGNNAFECCFKLSSVTIPNSVTVIGQYAFSTCPGLTSVTIPSSVNLIGQHAFSSSNNISSIICYSKEPPTMYADAFDDAEYQNAQLFVRKGSTSKYENNNAWGQFVNINEVDMGGFHVDGIYYNKIGENEVEVTYKNENWDNQNTYVGNIKIPSQVIYDGATYSVTGIGENAFFDCTGLTSVTIPNSVTSIGQGAFYYCPRLASVNFPNSLKSIGIYAFYNCLSLTSVTIPDSVTSIGPAVFGGCENIAQLSIERGNEKFFTDGHSIFEKLEGGKVELNNFIVWDVSYKIPSFVTSIGNNAFEYCSRLTSVTIPNSVTVIGQYAFSRCSGLTSLTIPNSVTSIGEQAFNRCIGLTSVTISNSVQNLKNAVFYECSNLMDLSLGAGLRNIEEGAFAFCFSIRKITCYAVRPPLVQLNSFRYEVFDHAVVYVPRESLNDYKSDRVWKRFFSLYGAELTGINGVTIEGTDNGEQKVYDLQGRKLQRPAKGLNIINGKKVLMK